MRRVSTLVGMSIVLAAPLTLRAQTTGPASVVVCLPCHGPAIDTAQLPPEAPPIPTLDGQHAEYLEKQLREFKAGRRKNALMAPILANMSKGRFRELAAHFASQTPVPRAVQNPQLVERGRVLYEQGNETTGVPGCVGCHLPNGVGTPRYPRLAGQRQTYIVQQLTNFKNRVRTNDRAHVMRNIAGNLSDEEMVAIAEYLASLKGV